jgi:prophage regulatory protein
MPHRYTLTTLWRLERDGRFPKKVKIGDAAVAYYEHEIEEWIRSRVRGGCRPVRAPSKAKAGTGLGHPWGRAGKPPGQEAA